MDAVNGSAPTRDWQSLQAARHAVFGGKQGILMDEVWA